MKLPPEENLKCESHRLLFEHDQKELHHENPCDYFAAYYRNRFCIVEEEFEIVFKKSQKTKPEFLILDVGCAQGNFSLAWAEEGFRVFSVDLQFDFLTYAQMKHEKGSFFPVNASLERLPFAEGVFDFVFAGELIEHVAYPRDFLCELKRVCKPGGSILLTTPNGERFLQKLPTYSKVRGVSDLEQKQFKPDADGHLFLMTRSELLQEAKAAGLVFQKSRYLAAPWFTGRLGWRFLFKAFMPRLASCLDFLLMNLPALPQKIADNQLAVFTKKQ